MMGVASLLVLLVWTQALPPPAPVDRAAKSQAQQLLRDGSKLYRKGKYQEALDRFNQAYTLFPSPKLHFNVAQANRALGRSVEAMNAFEKFLVDPAGSPRAAVAQARRSAAGLRAELARIQLECDTLDAEVLLDDIGVGRTPLPRPLWATPGEHRFSVRREGFVPWSEPVEVEAGTIRILSAALVPLPVVPEERPVVLALPVSARPVEVSKWSRLSRSWWFWGAAAVAVGGGIVAAVAWSGGRDVPGSGLTAHTMFR